MIIYIKTLENITSFETEKVSGEIYLTGWDNLSENVICRLTLSQLGLSSVLLNHLSLSLTGMIGIKALILLYIIF